ncbi:MAG: hypothetical protein ACE5GA_08415 [Candidatus Zixiibacteriota bacterium]
MIVYGSLIGALALGWFAFDFVFHSGGFITAGPLSSNHANFAEQCEKCHVSAGDVTDARCSICHEKSGDRTGVYSFAAHYVYVSSDPTRARGASVNRAHETECRVCHTEHNGRDDPITSVSDERCLGCHDYGSFNSRHPEFEFLRGRVPDDSALKFTHARHTKFVIERFEKEGKNTFIEQACLNCHRPDAQGLGFQPLDFDEHCSNCHLTSGSRTATLEVARADVVTAGVETLEMIQQRRGPAARWAFYVNPNELSLKARGAKVVKAPVYHEDPWIMENLATLRGKLYGNTDLFDLVPLSGSLNPIEAEALRNEVVDRLTEKVDLLRGRPEDAVQADIVILDSLMDLLSELLPSLTTRELSALFNSDSLAARPELSVEQRASLEAFVEKLTGGPNKLCQECHYVERSAIRRVRADQSTLARSVFDHHAHILDRGCLDCHNVIPIVSDTAIDTTLQRALDRSATTNLPGISNCRECHSSRQVSNSCVSCHLFHPNKSGRSNFQLFAEKKK